MNRPKKFVEVTAGLPRRDLRHIDKIAAAEETTRSQIIRTAIAHYLKFYEQKDKNEQETILEQRLRKIENRLANLTVLSTRAAAQTLYYMTLPYSLGGLPPRPLKDEVFNQHWNKSRHFASMFLKNALLNPPDPKAGDKKKS
jgi:hypothetical protein